MADSRSDRRRERATPARPPRAGRRLRTYLSNLRQARGDATTALIPVLRDYPVRRRR
jgi:hypothetical protein